MCDRCIQSTTQGRKTLIIPAPRACLYTHLHVYIYICIYFLASLAKQNYIYLHYTLVNSCCDEASVIIIIGIREQKKKHTTVGIRWWSLTQLLTGWRVTWTQSVVASWVSYRVLLFLVARLDVSLGEGCECTIDRVSNHLLSRKHFHTIDPSSSTW